MSSNVATSPEFERFRATFFEECAEILPELDERLSSLHVGEVDSETLNAIFRAVHSIKAGAAAFNFKALVEFAHIFEALLDRLRDNRIQQTEHVFNVIVRAGDVLAEVGLPVEQPHRHQRQPEIGRALEMVAGEHAEAARVDGQRFVDAELRREIRDRPGSQDAGVLQAPRMLRLHVFAQPADQMPDAGRDRL